MSIFITQAIFFWFPGIAGSGIEDRGSSNTKRTIKSQKLKPCDRPARLPLYANVHSGLFL